MAHLLTKGRYTYIPPGRRLILNPHEGSQSVHSCLPCSTCNGCKPSLSSFSSQRFIMFNIYIYLFNYAISPGFCHHHDLMSMLILNKHHGSAMSPISQMVLTIPWLNSRLEANLLRALEMGVQKAAMPRVRGSSHGNKNLWSSDIALENE